MTDVTTVGMYLGTPYTTDITLQKEINNDIIDFGQTVCHLCQRAMNIVPPSGFKTDSNIIIASYGDDCTLYPMHSHCITID